MRTYHSEINWNEDSAAKCSCCSSNIADQARLNKENLVAEHAAAATAILEPVILAAAAAQMNHRRESVSQCDASPLLIPPIEQSQQVIIDCAVPVPKIEV